MKMLTFSLDTWAWISPDTVPIDWREYWAAARADWRDGFALWCMVVTTLAPTLIHFFIGIEAWVSHAARLRLGVLQQITDKEAEVGVDGDFDTITCDHLAAQLRNANIVGILIATIVTVVVIFGLGSLFWLFV
jgi:hypothetical protein